MKILTEKKCRSVENCKETRLVTDYNRQHTWNVNQPIQPRSPMMKVELKLKNINNRFLWSK